ncbi:MAG: NFACT RNA binding domain-containing protein [Candidatus Micrarchaeia archaeon]
MRVELDVRKGAGENAAKYFEGAKKLREKARRAREAVEATKRKLAGLKEEKREKPAVRFKRARGWFEKFRWFFSTDGFLVIAGRDAAQNDLLYSKHMEETDLFLHADIQGAPAVVVKNGMNAPEKTLEEAAQWAASYSSAWKTGAASVDVYAVRKEQLSKKAVGGYVGRGAFAISGERRWFRGTQLGLRIGVSESGVIAAPESVGKDRFSRSVLLRLGEKEKGEAARELAKKWGVSADEVLVLLPSGRVRLVYD